MTQPASAIVAPPPPIVAAPPTASEQGEPTMEELAALVPEPTAETVEPVVVAAAPAEGEPAVVEPAPKEEPVVVEPDAEARAAVAAAMERAEKAAAKARAGSRRYAETQRQLAEQSFARQRAAQEAEQLREANRQHAEREAAFKADPYKTLKDAGMTDVQLAERAMRENSPEAITARLETQLQEERTARLALETRLDTERRAAVMESRQRQAEVELVGIAKDAAVYPELAAAKPETQLWAARQALAQIGKRGHNTLHLTMTQVAEAADLWLADHLASLGVKKPVAAAPPPPVVPTKVKPSGITLTNKASQTRTVAPAQWDELTEEQQLAHLAQGLPDPA